MSLSQLFCSSDLSFVLCLQLILQLCQMGACFFFLFFVIFGLSFVKLYRALEFLVVSIILLSIYRLYESFF